MERNVMRKKQDELHRKIMSMQNGGKSPVRDGVVNIDDYSKRPFKIMWILKEPYDDETDADGGWFQFEEIDPSVVSKLPSLRKIAYVSALLLKDEYSKSDYDSLPPCNEIEKISKILQSIAFINTGKFLAKKRTLSQRLAECYNFWKEILHDQILLYDADVLFFGGTFNLYANFFQNEYSHFSASDTVKAICHEVEFNSKKHLLVDTWHPGYLKKEEDYVNALVALARDWQKANNLFAKNK